MTARPEGAAAGCRRTAAATQRQCHAAAPAQGAACCPAPHLLELVAVEVFEVHGEGHAVEQRRAGAILIPALNLLRMGASAWAAMGRLGCMALCQSALEGVITSPLPYCSMPGAADPATLGALACEGGGAAAAWARMPRQCCAGALHGGCVGADCQPCETSSALTGFPAPAALHLHCSHAAARLPTSALSLSQPRGWPMLGCCSRASRTRTAPRLRSAWPTRPTRLLAAGRGPASNTTSRGGRDGPTARV